MAGLDVGVTPSAPSHQPAHLRVPVGATVLHPEHTLCTAENVKAWHTSGRPVNAWTVDDPQEMRRLTVRGVDGIFTNDPARALSVLST